ncbi:ABC transporter permease [Cellulomonas sp. PhB150]|uniref:ABC transporter permease n=1 Tax=Cellulomonas sp. PhB150 TaxID=2485188 RepID=UPI000F49B447|nr:ABC transporter permease [Cellulomonas sp. PhB150]ROS31013.1 ABC-2 type transport system permease protein [Cellulomonas sp. PhB150]
MTAVAVPVTGPRRGLNATFLTIELRRLLRNRRGIIFTLVMPPVFFLLFGTVSSYKTESVGHANVTAWIMISMALYGAILATTSGGASVSVERAQGWTRQLRLTPLSPTTYVVTKVAVAMVMGLGAVVVTAAVGMASGATGDTSRIVASLALAWVGSSVFAAFGLFMGYLLPSENVMQILGPVLALLSFAGGLFMPLGDGVFATIAQFVPTYGLAEIVRGPITDEGVSMWAVVNVVAWGIVFVVGAAWRFRRDTARV